MPTFMKPCFVFLAVIILVSFAGPVGGKPVADRINEFCALHIEKAGPMSLFLRCVDVITKAAARPATTKAERVRIKAAFECYKKITRIIVDINNPLPAGFVLENPEAEDKENLAPASLWAQQDAIKICN